jgi:hypothetical protein
MVFAAASRERHKDFLPAGGPLWGLTLSVTAFSGYKLRVDNILVTGGTGFIGKRLVSTLLDSGRTVTVFGRDAGRIRLEFGGKARCIPWNFLESGTWTQELSGRDAIIHLAGEPAVGRRLTDTLKRKIRDSRVKSTRRLVDAIGQTSIKPKVLICASGVGVYGNRPSGGPLDETSPLGDDFMAEVCHEWESAAVRAELFGVRVVMARLGIVLGGRGGLIERLLPLFRTGFGGRLGSGQQPMSWISLDDVVSALLFCAERESVRGPVNVVAPNWVSNGQFTRALADAVQRSALLRVPEFALKLAFGEGAEVVLGGQQVTPALLLREGFEFRYPELPLALAAAIARS